MYLSLISSISTVYYLCIKTEKNLHSFYQIYDHSTKISYDGIELDSYIFLFLKLRIIHSVNCSIFHLL